MDTNKILESFFEKNLKEANDYISTDRDDFLKKLKFDSQGIDPSSSEEMIDEFLSLVERKQLRTEGDISILYLHFKGFYQLLSLDLHKEYPEGILGVTLTQEKLERIRSHTAIGIPHTGQMNALSFSGRNQTESNLLLFDVTLSQYYSMLCSLLSQIIISYNTIIPKCSESVPESFFDEISKRNPDLVKGIFHLTLSAACLDAPLVASQWFSKISLLEKKFARMILNSCLRFIIGHECTHLILDHVSQIRKRKNDNHIPHEIHQFIRNIKKQPHIEIPKAKTLKNRLDHHSVEFEADLVSVIFFRKYYSLQSAKEWETIPEDQYESKLLSSLAQEIGLMLPLIAMDFLEKIILTLSHGEDYLEHPINSLDSSTVDLLTRDFHPSPKSRIAAISQTDAGNTFICEFLEQFFDRLLQQVTPELTSLHEEGARPHRKWISQSRDLRSTLRLF